MSMYQEISEMIQEGNSLEIGKLVLLALDQGMEASAILEEGLMNGMNVIGELFKNNEVYIPEVLMSARAMSAGIDILKPYLIQANSESKGVVVIGTVLGDLHDIGKNLVKIMLEGKGLTVIDLGVDVTSEKFIEAAKENKASIICCSSLLTTTMMEMKKIVVLAANDNLCKNMKIIIGGAPINQKFCDSIGAHCYTADAVSAAEAAVELCEG